jgi:hypothetical protein
MTCFPLLVDVIYNKHKCVKASSKVVVTIVALTRARSTYMSMTLITIMKMIAVVGYHLLRNTT